PVQVNGVMAHRTGVGQSNANSFSQLNDQRFGAWKGPGVKREHVEVEHLIRIGTTRADNDLPLVQHKREIPIWSWRLGGSRMNYEQPHLAQCHLCHFIVMRVVHVSAML